MIPKFRAWEPDPKFMNYQVRVTVNRFGSNEVWVEVTDAFKWIEVDSKYLMQATGLKDKNGVEIFEGDLVEHDDNINVVWETFEACEIVYDEGYAQFCFKWDAGNFLTDYRNLNVIGNIYENPDLLERG